MTTINVENSSSRASVLSFVTRKIQRNFYELIRTTGTLHHRRGIIHESKNRLAVWIGTVLFPNTRSDTPQHWSRQTNCGQARQLAHMIFSLQQMQQQDANDAATESSERSTSTEQASTKHAILEHFSISNPNDRNGQGSLHRLV